MSYISRGKLTNVQCTVELHAEYEVGHNIMHFDLQVGPPGPPGPPPDPIGPVSVRTRVRTDLIVRPRDVLL